jgi:hypothetical protein
MSRKGTSRCASALPELKEMKMGLLLKVQNPESNLKKEMYPGIRA